MGIQANHDIKYVSIKIYYIASKRLRTGFCNECHPCHSPPIRTTPICNFHVVLEKTVSEGCRMPSVFESDACDFETVIVQLLCLWWVECVVGMVLVTVEYLLCSYLVSEEMKKVMDSVCYRNK